MGTSWITEKDDVPRESHRETVAKKPKSKPKEGIEIGPKWVGVRWFFIWNASFTHMSFSLFTLGKVPSPRKI